MTRLLCLSLSIALCGCSFFRNEDKGNPPGGADINRVMARAEFYAESLGDPYKLVDRCDSLTFVGHYAAGLKPNVIAIGLHEYTVGSSGVKTYKTGQWHRSKEPCNNDADIDDSRSECSKENILGAFHAMLTNRDYASILRTIRYGRGNDWSFCSGGDASYNKMVEFGPLLNDWEELLTNSTTLVGDDDAMAIPSLAGYRGNVLASYILLKGRAFGYINTAEKVALQKLINDVPGSPLYHAIYHRFTDGDQTRAVTMMDGSGWSNDSMPPSEKDAGPWSWQGGDSRMMYVWTAKVIGDL
jgi:hypothetical protein